MACAYTERVVLSQQLITCSRELAGLAQRAAELFADLGESVASIDTTLGRLAGRVVALDQKVSDAKAAQDAQGEMASGARPTFMLCLAPRMIYCPRHCP